MEWKEKVDISLAAVCERCNKPISEVASSSPVGDNFCSCAPASVESPLASQASEPALDRWSREASESSAVIRSHAELSPARTELDSEQLQDSLPSQEESSLAQENVWLQQEPFSPQSLTTTQVSSTNRVPPCPQKTQRPTARRKLFLTLGIVGSIGVALAATFGLTKNEDLQPDANSQPARETIVETFKKESQMKYQLGYLLGTWEYTLKDKKGTLKFFEVDGPMCLGEIISSDGKRQGVGGLVQPDGTLQLNFSKGEVVSRIVRILTDEERKQVEARPLSYTKVGGEISSPSSQFSAKRKTAGRWNDWSEQKLQTSQDYYLALQGRWALQFGNSQERTMTMKGMNQNGVSFMFLSVGGYGHGVVDDDGYVILKTPTSAWTSPMKLTKADGKWVMRDRKNEVCAIQTRTPKYPMNYPAYRVIHK